MTFKIKDIKQCKDGTFSIEWETPEDFDVFQKMATDHFKEVKYTAAIGNKYFNYLIKLALGKLH
jgi:hypothetical protein